MDVLGAVLTAVDRARWVRVESRTRRIFVWRGGPSVDVYSTATGEWVDDWPCEDSAVSADAVVEERRNKGY
jgi:hypothetical protein